MKKIAITGATGFLGSNLTRLLVQNGLHVCVLKRSTSSISRLGGIDPQMIEFEDLDTKDADSLESLSSCQSIVHLATNYGRNQQGLAEIWNDNVVFGLRLAEQAAVCGVKTFISIGTLLPPGVSPYALSKFHFVNSAQWLNPAMRFISCNFDHLYGPGDDSQKFLGWLFENFSRGEGTVPLTKGEQFRDFLYVSDAARAILAILNHSDSIENKASFEIGSGNLVTIRSIVEMAKVAWEKISGKPLGTFLEFGNRPYRNIEPNTPKIDISMLRNFGWHPEIDLQTGLNTLARWYFEKGNFK